MPLKPYSALALAALLATPALAQQPRKAAKTTKPAPNYELRGTLQSAPTGSKVYVVDYNDGRATRLDSATVDAKGQFSLRGTVAEPAVYYLGAEQKQELLAVPLAAGTKLDVRGNAEKLAASGAATGSPEAEALATLQRARMENARKSMELRQRYRGTADDAARAAIEREAEALDAQLTALTKQMARRPTYLAPFAALSLLGDDAQTAFLDSVTAVYQKIQPVSRYTKALLAHQARQRATAVGATAPDIRLTGVDGKIIPLSSLRGKYVMIDFWASWCGPCRQENPNVVKLYNAYKSKGFEIYGVSLDQDKAKWQKAIETDGLAWTQVSDLKGWQSAAGQAYGVQSIPATVLIDPQGRIVAKNLRGEALEKKVAELLH
ncbi:AhpC/TSA family protein [Hymenobacter gummosus]|uniref:AhpC/TSA family protein n=1 Tax=Hymenobacter gummosus TaxID=1776032 RepID=A0A431TVC1_9BACT|nr:TlpA disulfide reductase family protein [Hymenobacter gummosus]RTQ45617.1 AhpC/TSA family protein [Hymenobacter gummosus]